MQGDDLGTNYDGIRNYVLPKKIKKYVVMYITPAQICESNIHHFQYNDITRAPEQSVRAIHGLVIFLQNKGSTLANKDLL